MPQAFAFGVNIGGIAQSSVKTSDTPHVDGDNLKPERSNSYRQFHNALGNPQPESDTHFQSPLASLPRQDEDFLPMRECDQSIDPLDPGVTRQAVFEPAWG
jgi:hypothetical protein